MFTFPWKVSIFASLHVLCQSTCPVSLSFRVFELTPLRLSSWLEFLVHCTYFICVIVSWIA